MNISEIKKCGFYRATNSDYFLIEVTKLSEIDEIVGEPDVNVNGDSLFVDVWFHSMEKPYCHPEGVYQSNGIVYSLDAVPDAFSCLDLVEDVYCTHRAYGKDGKMLSRKPKLRLI